jgi:xanthine phosphoribosyltransferase
MEEKMTRPRQMESWTSVMYYCNNLVEQIVQRDKIVEVVALARGGMVPAAIIANALDIRVVRSIYISSYVDDVKQGHKCEPLAPYILSHLNQPNILFVDDIVDSGGTYRFVKHHFPKVQFAAMLARYSSPNLPDYYSANIIENDAWVVFPWEKTS